ncbi:hypothetical protein C1H46_027450 [Malus baccata]|uniref:Uncharacterized protein n=1 Tax=Malus baccata TaxID=106549 RepID=A0A540LL58_MALBA|nr:hypothetical protein C1H46_027450 [Malus baccata]
MCLGEFNDGGSVIPIWYGVAPTVYGLRIEAYNPGIQAFPHQYLRVLLVWDPLFCSLHPDVPRISGSGRVNVGEGCLVKRECTNGGNQLSKAEKSGNKCHSHRRR